MDTKCAECDAGLEVPKDAIPGEIVSCKECGVEYEVSEVRNGTVMLKPAEKAEEDWGE